MLHPFIEQHSNPRPETVSIGKGNTATMINSANTQNAAANNVVDDERGVFDSATLPSRGFLSRVAKGVAIAAAGFGLSYEAPQSRGGEADDGVSQQTLINNAQPYIAENGGPAATLETVFTDGSVIHTTITLLNSNSIVGPEHIFAQGGDTLPDLSKVASMTVLTGPNYITNRGQAIPVDLSSVKLAPGYDGTLATLDMFGAKLVGAGVTGLGHFTIAAPVSTQLQVANDYYVTPSNANNPIRTGDFMAGNAPLDITGGLQGNASTTYYYATDFGLSKPPGLPEMKFLGGASGAPTLEYFASTFDPTTGRLTSAIITGFNVAQSGDGAEAGTSINVNFGGPGGADANAFMAPEPNGAFVTITLLGITGLLVRAPRGERVAGLLSRSKRPA